MCSFLILPIEIYNKIDINKINKKLKRRGPDNTNIIIHNGYVFIHNLLHMCGEKVNQPIFNKNKDILILFNGEIYNYLDFGNFISDVECLLYLYEFCLTILYYFVVLLIIFISSNLLFDFFVHEFNLLGRTATQRCTIYLLIYYS